MKNDSKELQFIGDYPYPKEMTSGKLKGHVQAYYDPKSDMVVIRLRKFAESPEEKETVEEVTA